jgi:hypothetical protein
LAALGSPLAAPGSGPPAKRPDNDSRALAKSVTIPHVPFAAAGLAGAVPLGRDGPRCHRLFRPEVFSLREPGPVPAGGGCVSSEFILVYNFYNYSAPASYVAR